MVTIMTIMTRIYPVLALVACANVAYAQDNSFLPDAKIPAGSAQTWNVGAGVTQKLLHTNLEWVNPYGIAYAKAGVFINDDYPVGGQLGFRFPVHFTGKDKNGYYLGVYAGHIDSKKVDGEYESRLGGGVDLAYVFLVLNESALSVWGLVQGKNSKPNRAMWLQKLNRDYNFPIL